MQQQRLLQAEIRSEDFSFVSETIRHFVSGLVRTNKLDNLQSNTYTMPNESVGYQRIEAIFRNQDDLDEFLAVLDRIPDQPGIIIHSVSDYNY